MTQDTDKLEQIINDGFDVYADINKALEDDGKIDFLEGTGLVLKNGGKAIRLIAAFKEIGQELKDLDGNEAAKLAEIITKKFGDSPQVNEAIIDIAKGAGLINKGVSSILSL